MEAKMAKSSENPEVCSRMETTSNADWSMFFLSPGNAEEKAMLVSQEGVCSGFGLEVRSSTSGCVEITRNASDVIDELGISLSRSQLSTIRNEIEFTVKDEKTVLIENTSDNPITSRVGTHVQIPNTSGNIEQQEFKLSRSQYRTIRNEIKISLKGEKSKQFRERRSSKRPKYCWIIENGVLTPLSICTNNCSFHKMRRSRVFSLIKYNTRYKHLMQPLRKYKEKVTDTRTPPPPPQQGVVDELERMLAHSHIDTNRDVFSGFSEVVAQMENFDINDIEMDRK